MSIESIIRKHWPVSVMILIVARKGEQRPQNCNTMLTICRDCHQPVIVSLGETLMNMAGIPAEITGGRHFVCVCEHCIVDYDIPDDLPDLQHYVERLRMESEQERQQR